MSVSVFPSQRSVHKTLAMMYQNADTTRKSLNLFKLLESLIQKFQGITLNLLITKRKYFNSTLSITTRLQIKFQREYTYPRVIHTTLNQSYIIPATSIESDIPKHDHAPF